MITYTAAILVGFQNLNRGLGVLSDAYLITHGIGNAAQSLAIGETEAIALSMGLHTASAAALPHINSLWLTTATFLVLFMQIGFLALESGWVRSKNSISVAQRNLADFCICFLAFFFCGFTIAFGSSTSGFAGWDWGNRSALIETHIDQFLFQAVFAGAAVTIASGTLAERMKFTSYLMLAAVTSILIYPVVCHWIWGNSIIPDNKSWLTDLGFVDFAGSTVVHSVGGWISLACAIILGPRIGKFDEQGKAQKMPCHSMVLSGIGALILLISWIGFNAGTSQAGSPVFKQIILNTLVSGTAGMLAAMIFGYILDRKSFQPDRSTNGLLGGLVGITASCHAVDMNSAFFIGAICGSCCCLAQDFIEHKLKIDDVVGAISVHGVCGALGTILFAVFASEENLIAGSRLDQLIVQAFGVAVVFTYVFGLGFILISAINKIFPIRVSTEDELRGSNLAEHNITLETETFLEREREVNEEQRQFIRMATHEFRTPLSIIDTLAQNLRRRWDKYSKEKAEGKISSIQKSVKRLTTLIDTILNAGNLDHGGIKYDPQPTNVRQFFTEKLKQFELISERHRVNLELLCPLDSQIDADPFLFEHIIDNMVSNAVKYSPNADKLDIIISASMSDLSIVIRDYGLGIPKAEIPNLFKKYFRASTSSGIGGTGIGLTVVKKFIDMHNGTVEVESIVDEGTTFTLTFPLLEEIIDRRAS